MGKFEAALLELADIKESLQKKENVKMKFDERGGFFYYTGHRIGKVIDDLVESKCTQHPQA